MGASVTDRVVDTSMAPQASPAPLGRARSRGREVGPGYGQWVVGAALLAVALLVLRRLDPPIWIDFQVYRWAVTEWAQGAPITGGHVTTTVGLDLPWVYPPFAVLVLAPFAIVPYPMGGWLLAAVGLVALAGTVHLVLREFARPPAALTIVVPCAVAAVAVLTLEPVRASLGLGQVNILLMGLVTVDLLARHRRWPRGVLLGIAIGIKLTPAVFLLVLLLRRDVRGVLRAAAVAMATVLVGFLIAAQDSAAYWFGGAPAHQVGGSAYVTNQSVWGALSRLDLGSGALPVGAVLVVAALAAVVVGSRARPSAGPVDLLLATGLLGLLASPTSWSDHWVWVAPMAVVATAEAVRSRTGAAWIVPVTVVTVFALTPLIELPAGGLAETRWTPWEHLVGNSYGLIAFAVLAAYAARSVRSATSSLRRSADVEPSAPRRGTEIEPSVRTTR